MTHQDKLSILITFSVGIFAGMYLYLTGFATTFKLPEVTTENVYTEFVVTAESYGACRTERTCLSFQVLENGTYRALLDDPRGGETIVKEGRIPRSIRGEMLKALTSEQLLSDTRTWAVPDCQFGEGGTNYTFRVTRDEVNYEMDTCQSVIDYEGPGWKSLAKLWNYFATLQ
jgi:hypothetical protein